MIIKDTIDALPKSPWNKAGTTTTAELNTDDIYQMGKVGIGHNNPVATLDVSGSFVTRESAVTVSGSSVTIPNNAIQIVINGGSQNFTIQPPTGSFVSGHRIVIYNNTNYNGTFSGYEIFTKQAIEFIYSNATWVSTSPITSVSRMYVGQAKIPPHSQTESVALRVADWTNFGGIAATYATSDWRIFSKQSFASTATDTSRMTLVYEYTGAPFNLTRVYPMLTTGNDQSYPDTYIATFIKIENVSGKTRLTVSVSRTDKIGVNTNWAGIFLLNISLVNTL